MADFIKTRVVTPDDNVVYVYEARAPEAMVRVITDVTTFERVIRSGLFSPQELINMCSDKITQSIYGEDDEYLKVTQLLYSNYPTMMDPLLSQLYVAPHGNHSFASLQFLRQLGSIPPHLNDQLFWASCRSGNLQVAQCLYNNAPISINLFRQVCLNGHVAVARWLTTLDDRLFVAGDDETLYWCVFPTTIHHMGVDDK